MKIIFNWSSPIDLQDRLSGRGLKSTPQRKCVFDVLTKNTGRPMTPDQIHQFCLKTNPGLGLTTVYRTLELFCDIGVAMRVHLHEPSRYYELNTGKHHHHLVCVTCGIVEPIDVCMIDDMNDMIRDNHDFVVTSHCLSLFGYCPMCLPKPN